jgi:PAS domain S-box-containing protein
MPKKKPIDKRLNKLFTEITPEQVQSDPKAGMQQPSSDPAAQLPVDNPPAIKPRESGQIVKSTAAPGSSVMSLAFQTGQSSWATLQIMDEADGRKWSQDEQLLVKQVADQLSLALENAQLFQETQSRAEELVVLNELGNELATKLDPKPIADAVYRYTSRLMDTRFFFVALYDEKNSVKQFPVAYQNGVPAQFPSSKVTGSSLTDYIIQNKKPVFAPEDPQGYQARLGIENLPPAEDSVAAKCWLGVPMLIGERVLGVISVQSIEKSYLFDNHDRELLVAIASQAAIAVENARLFAEAQSRARETAVLAEVGREISATLDLNQVLGRITGAARDLLLGETCAVYLPDEQGERWTAVAATGVDEKEIKGDPIQRGRGILGSIIALKQGRIANNASAGTEAVTIAGTEVKSFEHLMGTPILVGDKLTGIMAIWRTGEGLDFIQSELEYLGSLAQQAAIAIENARLFKNVTDSQLQLSEALRIARIGYFEIALEDRSITLTDEFFSLVNTTAEKEGGYQFPLQEVLDRFVVHEDIAGVAQTLLDVITSTEEHPDKVSEVRYKTSDGRILWVSSIYRLENDANGTAVKIAGSSQDITDRKTNELIQKAITYISESALASNTIEELTRSVHEAVGSVVPARNFYIALYNNESGMIQFPYHADEVDEDWTSRKLGRGLTSYVIRTGRPLRATPEILADLEASGEISPDGVRSFDWIGVPLRSKQLVKGVMAVQTYESSISRLTERHTSILSILATQVASAIERLEAREALAKSEADLRALFSSMQDVVLVVDKDTRYVRIAPTNPSRLFRPPEELLGKRMDELLPDETHEIFHQAIRHALETNEVVQIEYRLPIEGQGYWFLASISRLNDEQVFWVARDITERKKAEEVLQRRNDYLAASSEIGRLVTSTLELNTIFTRTANLISERFGFYFAAIYIVEETGFNARLQEATGKVGEIMKSQKYSVGVGSSSIVGRVADRGESILINDTTQDALFASNPLLPDTRSQVAIPLRIGLRTVGVIDIQSLQTYAFTEDDISVLQSLADQVAVAIDNARSYQLSQQLIKDLREVDQIKSQFLANMSHELRTPLNSIIGFSRVILKGIDGPITDIQQQDLTAIYNSGGHLLGLINDILDLARIEAGKMELNFEEVHIVDMVTSVFSTAKGLVKEKPIQLIQRIPADMPAVRGDTMRVRQILLNLISNASKFTDEGTITVEASVQKGPAGKMEALINVTDTGPGISLEDQEKLFKAFSQVDGSATRKSGGSGLGLSICANLVQLHGGRISVRSEVGNGSTFWFTLPLYHQPQQEIPQGKRIILAIDDDPQVIGLYERYLTPKGYYVVPLTDPAKARERILEMKPYAVTLDIMMPHMDGWSVLAEIKADPGTRDVPVVICSIVEQEEKGYSLGAADYLLKPILEEDLVHAMDRLNPAGAVLDVLIIDDDPNDLRLMEKVLLDNGRYRPILAQGGVAGWELLKAMTPSAVVLDLVMPDLDGFSILEKLRTDPTLCDIPVLVVSGGSLTEDQLKQLNDFGQQIVSKGTLKENEFIASIEEALSRVSP